MYLNFKNRKWIDTEILKGSAKTAQQLADDEVTRIKHDLWRATQSQLNVNTAGYIQACKVRVYWPAPTTAAELAEGAVAFLGLSEPLL